MAAKSTQNQAKVRRQPRAHLCSPEPLLAPSTTWSTHCRACWEASRFCKGQAINFESKGAFRQPAAGLAGGRAGGSAVPRPPLLFEASRFSWGRGE